MLFPRWWLIGRVTFGCGFPCVLFNAMAAYAFVKNKNVSHPCHYTRMGCRPDGRGERIREMKEVVKIVQQIVVADACELHTPLNLWVNKGYFCRFYKRFLSKKLNKNTRQPTLFARENREKRGMAYAMCLSKIGI